VESSSVTPFASRARDRALHAVLVALIRHLIPDILDKPKLTDVHLKEIDKIVEYIVERGKTIDPDESDVKRELQKLIELWKIRRPNAYWSRKAKSSLLQDAERAATLRAMGRFPGDAWPTLNNMRSVEASTKFRLAERLRQRNNQEQNNGKE
jgi:hypothetical protein